MKKTITLFLICILFLSTNSFAKIVWRTLPQLVHDAPNIVKGTISIQKTKVTLNIEKVLKGENHKEMIILFHHDIEVPDPQFKIGEEVLLFLEPQTTKSEINQAQDSNDIKMYLFGLGDQAKWPRFYPNNSDNNAYYLHYPKLQDTASLKTIQNVVEKLLIIEDANSIDEKVKICNEYIKSSDKLLQFTSLQFVIQDRLWPPQSENTQEPAPSSSTIAERNSILKKFGEEIIALSLIDDKEATIRAEAIRFLRYTEPYKAISFLIPKLTDDDRLVRSNSREVLNNFSGELKLTKELASYKSDDTMENYKSIQQNWNTWKEKNADKFIKED
jgi:hypothetical protein